MKKLSTQSGRIIFGVVFGLFGLFHFMNGQGMADMMIPSWLPGGVFFVYLSGLALIAAALSIIIKVKIKLATQLLALLLVLIILIVHVPGMMADPENPAFMSNILKDLGLAGAALFMSGQFSK